MIPDCPYDLARLLALAGFLETNSAVEGHFSEVHCDARGGGIEDSDPSTAPAILERPAAGITGSALAWATILWPEIACQSGSWEFFGRRVFLGDDYLNDPDSPLDNPAWEALNEACFGYDPDADQHEVGSKIRAFVSAHGGGISGKQK